MRATVVIVLAALVGATGGSGSAHASATSQLYAKHADAAFAAGKWGEAMAAYDAAYNEAPGDAAITAHRRDAAARWVESMAPEQARATPGEKALVLLDSLAQQGRKRGADAAVDQHVAPLLEKVVSELWSADQASDEPGALWKAVRRGEQLTQSLPEASAPRVKLAALRARAVARFNDLAKEASHPGSVYLYQALAAYLGGGKAPAAAVKGLGDVTEFDFKLALERPASCPLLADELRKRLDFFHNLDPRPGGLPAEVQVAVDCVPLAPPRQRQESRSWVDSHLEFTSAKHCVDRTVMATSGSYSVTHSQGMGGVRYTTYTDVSPSYKTVPDCSTDFSSRTVTENKSDVVTITTQEYGYNVRGVGIIGVHGKAYRMPISSRVVFDKVTTAGRIFGVREDGVIPTKDFLTLAAHGIWLELLFLGEHAREGFVAELLAKAAGESGDARLGDMVSAVRVHHRVTGEYARWFGEQLGLDEQDVNELILDAARVKRTLKLGDYKLELPKVDPGVARAAADKKRSSGADDFR